MSIILETERLFLRPFHEDDAPFLYDLNSDPEVLKFTGDIPFKNEDAARQFAIDYIKNSQSQYQKYKMGRLAAILKDSNDFVGWAGFKYHEKEDFIDMGYRLRKLFWGKGFATELAERVLIHGFEDHNMTEVVAHVHEDNIASQKVVEKIGLTLKHKFLWSGMLPARHYEITATEFKKSKSMSHLNKSL